MKKKTEEMWEELSIDMKEKLIEKINENSEYKWEPNFWTKVYFERIPPVLKEELKKELKKIKSSEENFK